MRTGGNKGGRARRGRAEGWRTRWKAEEKIGVVGGLGGGWEKEAEGRNELRWERKSAETRIRGSRTTTGGGGGCETRKERRSNIGRGGGESK